jgi:23S rRNA pseudouridine955/2504/2580 synthase
MEMESGLESFLHRGVREVFRDGYLWALDKPAGVLSHPNPGRGASNGRALFLGDYDFKEEAYRLPIPGGKTAKVHLVHRLDQETSGLILCVFQGEAAARLKEALFHREVEKEYRALVLGIPSPARETWSDCLEKTSRGGRATVTARRGRPNAVTRYAVLERFERPCASLLALGPETGRTHQLRVQAALRGHPIAGDERYGDFTANRFLASEAGLKRMFLHAHSLELRHPVTGHKLRLRAPLPQRLLEALERAKTMSKRVPRRG